MKLNCNFVKQNAGRGFSGARLHSTLRSGRLARKAVKAPQLYVSVNHITNWSVMESVDISSIERKLKARNLVLPILRIFNSQIWVYYWLVFPVMLCSVPLLFALAFDESAEFAAVPLEIVSMWVAALLHYGTIRSIFGLERGWAWLSGLGFGAYAAILAVMSISPLTYFNQDGRTFATFVLMQVFTAVAVVTMILANVSVLRLTQHDRLLLPPVEPTRLYPRRKFRSLTCLPDVIDYVRGKWARGWISLLYVIGTGFFFVVPYSMFGAAGGFWKASREARGACEKSPLEAECIIATMHEYSVALLWSFPIAIIFGLTTARWLLRHAQKRLIFSLADVVSLDQRKPILFLRPFADDHVLLHQLGKSPIWWLFRCGTPAPTLEQLVLERFTKLGPVIAIGNPGDKQAPFGAARSYLPTDDWRSRVTQLIVEAQFIIVCIDSSEGVIWEFEHILYHGLQKKCIFMVHPRFFSSTENESLMRLTLWKYSKSQSSQPLEVTSNTPVLAWYYLNNNEVAICRAQHFSVSSGDFVISWFLQTNINP